MRRSVLVPLVMMAFATASTTRFLSGTIERYRHRSPNTVGVPDAAISRLRSTVPEGEALGFISDGTDPEIVGKRLYGVTYSLAPLLVENTANRRFVIGDFRSISNIPISLGQHRLRVVQDLGNGLFLLAAQ